MDNNLRWPLTDDVPNKATYLQLLELHTYLKAVDTRRPGLCVLSKDLKLYKARRFINSFFSHPLYSAYMATPGHKEPRLVWLKHYIRNYEKANKKTFLDHLKSLFTNP